MPSAVIESGRADFALKAVNHVLSKENVDHKSYKSYCRKFPSLVQTNGFAASVAYIAEKGDVKNNKDRSGKKDAYKCLYDHIEKWLNKGDLQTYVCGLETPEYRVVTKEVLALFNWLRRFASGLIEGDA